jgi:hypothetical protein
MKSNFVLTPTFIKSDVLTDHLIYLLAHVLFQLAFDVPSVEPEAYQNECEQPNHYYDEDCGVAVFESGCLEGWGAGRRDVFRVGGTNGREYCICVQVPPVLLVVYGQRRPVVHLVFVNLVQVQLQNLVSI